MINLFKILSLLLLTLVVFNAASLKVEGDALVGTLYTGARLNVPEERRVKFVHDGKEITPIIKRIGSEEFISLEIPQRGEIYIKPKDAEYWFFDYGHLAGVRAALDSGKCPFYEDVVQFTYLKFSLDHHRDVVYISEINPTNPRKIDHYDYAKTLQSRKTKSGSLGDEVGEYCSHHGSKRYLAFALFSLINPLSRA